VEGEVRGIGIGVWRGKDICVPLHPIFLTLTNRKRNE